MKALITHLVREHLDRIVEQSLLHCHAKGVHYIMLLNSPEQTIRLYYADSEHELWRNFPAEYGSTPMSVGFHSHHCNITLHCVKGVVINWIVDRSLRGFMADQFIWHSPIKGEKGEFLLYESQQVMDTVCMNVMAPGEVNWLGAQTIHTIAVDRGQEAAWLVFEGREDTAYEPFTWSNQDLTKIDLSGMYIKPEAEAVIALMVRAGLI